MKLQYNEDTEPKMQVLHGEKNLQPPCNTEMQEDDEDEIQFESGFNTAHLDK